jgi:hypothetical protein
VWLKFLFSKDLPQLQQRLVEEEKNYQEALKKDVPFFMLKEIKCKIKMLHLALSGAKDHANQS